MLVEKIALHRVEIKAQFCLLQDHLPLLFRLIPQGFPHPGQRFFEFANEAVIEAKKVVWPSRKETMQTTGAVFAFVVVMALFLYLTDKSLEWVLYDLVLGWKKS